MADPVGDAPVFDAAAWARLRDEVGRDDARELLRAMADDEIPERLGAFQQCVSTGDFACAARELRSLAEPAGRVGLARLARLAAELGSALRELARAQAAGAAPTDGAFDMEAAQRAVELACEEAIDVAAAPADDDPDGAPGEPGADDASR